MSLRAILLRTICQVHFQKSWSRLWCKTDTLMLILLGRTTWLYTAQYVNVERKMIWVYSAKVDQHSIVARYPQWDLSVILQSWRFSTANLLSTGYSISNIAFLHKIQRTFRHSDPASGTSALVSTWSTQPSWQAHGPEKVALHYQMGNVDIFCLCIGWVHKVQQYMTSKVSIYLKEIFCKYHDVVLPLTRKSFPSANFFHLFENLRVIVAGLVSDAETLCTLRSFHTSTVKRVTYFPRGV